PEPQLLAGLERDRLQLSWEERRWTRRRVRTVAGREIALALPTGTMLEPGVILLIERDWYLEVEALPEPLIAIQPGSWPAAIRAAFEIGNRHFPLAIEGETILVPDDPAMEQLALRLGDRWERRSAVFRPLASSPARHSHDT
ncbi:MAG TPA: urease accessory protein UreE, partial [Candidatus Binataceae bacterium]|nr:urease accessory protein UreE [Candidatus Binataceae bacterium]